MIHYNEMRHFEISYYNREHRSSKTYITTKHVDRWQVYITELRNISM